MDGVDIVEGGRPQIGVPTLGGCHHTTITLFLTLFYHHSAGLQHGEDGKTLGFSSFSLKTRIADLNKRKVLDQTLYPPPYTYAKLKPYHHG